MSENQHRMDRDFSRYDAMSTEELEEILRLDAAAPIEQESDTDLLFYIMEVLENRRRNNNTPGKTAFEAWESFQQNYMPSDEELAASKFQNRHRFVFIPWLRRAGAFAAALILMLCIPLSASALTWEEIREIIASWAKNTFSFVSSERVDEASEPVIADDLEYTSLQDLLRKSNRPYDIIPSKVPDRFLLDKIEKDVTPEQEVYRAYYLDGDDKFRIRVQTYLPNMQQNIESEEGFIDIYPVSGVDYYIYSNLNQLQVSWLIDDYECSISGDLSIDEVKAMIHTIGKG